MKEAHLRSDFGGDDAGEPVADAGLIKNRLYALGFRRSDEPDHIPRRRRRVRASAIDRCLEKAIAAGLIIPTEKVCVQCHNKKSPTFKGFNFAESSKKVHDKKPKP